MALSVPLLKFLAYIILWGCFRVLQAFYWILNGTYTKVQRSREPGHFHQSAHLLHIVFRHKFDEDFQHSGPENFITTHVGFVSPDYLLQDHVTLYSLSENEAAFVEVTEGVDVANSNVAAFHKHGQFENARRIITVPIETFHKLAEQIGDPRGTLIFCYNTTRCGGSLLCQIFEETGRCMGFNEPDVLDNVPLFLKENMPKEKLNKTVKNIIRFLCKPRKEKDILAYLIKPYSPAMNMSVYKELYPNSKHLFMYREGIKVAQSVMKAITQTPLLQIIFKGVTLHPLCLKLLVRAFGDKDSKFPCRECPSGLVFAIALWAECCFKYTKLQKEGYRVAGVKYEDLITHKTKAIRAVFAYCGVDDALVDAAAGALGRDSQRNSLFSRKILARNETVDLSEQEKVVSDVICDTFGLPRVPEPCVLEGTITGFNDE